MVTLVSAENDALVNKLADRLAEVVVKTHSQGPAKEEADYTCLHTDKERGQGASQHTAQRFKRGERQDTRRHITGLALIEKLTVRLVVLEVETLSNTLAKVDIRRLVDEVDERLTERQVDTVHEALAKVRLCTSD